MAYRQLHQDHGRINIFLILLPNLKHTFFCTMIGECGGLKCTCTCYRTMMVLSMSYFFELLYNNCCSFLSNSWRTGRIRFLFLNHSKISELFMKQWAFSAEMWSNKRRRPVKACAGGFPPAEEMLSCGRNAGSRSHIDWSFSKIYRCICANERKKNRSKPSVHDWIMLVSLNKSVRAGRSSRGIDTARIDINVWYYQVQLKSHWRKET